VKKLIFVLFILFSVIKAENPSYKIFKDNPQYNQTTGDYIIGSSMLATEYIVIPIMMKNVWWKNGFELRNPFVDKYGREDTEPYNIDESWHAAMTYLMQDGHYTILRRYFDVKSPYPSMGLTLFSWTLVEALDAMSEGTKWTFSWNDEIGNVAGILNWYIHYNFPKFKFYIRGGMRTWADFGNYFISSHEFFTDNDSYTKKYYADKYSISKVEYIYKWYDEFYSGVAVSKDDNSKQNIWGYTMGWDAMSFGNNKTKGWWNYPGRLFSASFSLSLSFTIWTDTPALTLF